MFSDGLNIAKFVLSIVSIVFDLIFMFQHYFLYNKKGNKGVDDLNSDSEYLTADIMKFNNNGYTQAN